MEPGVLPSGSNPAPRAREATLARLVVCEATARRGEETAWLHSGGEVTTARPPFSPVIPSLSPSSSSRVLGSCRCCEATPSPPWDLAGDGSAASLAAGAGFVGALLASALSAWAFVRGGGGAGAVLATVLQIGPLLACCCCRRRLRRSPSSPPLFLRWLAFSAMTNNPHYPMKMQ